MKSGLRIASRRKRPACSKLSQVIALSKRCHIACQMEAWPLAFRLMKERDDLYLELGPEDAMAYIRWGRAEINADRARQGLNSRVEEI